MEKWLDVLTPSAAALSLLLAIAVVVQAVRHGRAVRRLESRLAEREGAAARVSLDRLTQLQGRASTGSALSEPQAEPRLPRMGSVAAIAAVLALVAGTSWYLFIRDGESSGASKTTQTATTPPTTTAKPAPVSDNRVPETPEALPQSKSAYTILVLNGSGVSQAAARIVVPLVQQFGWNTAPPGNASTSTEKTAFVMFLPGKEAVADNVAKDLDIKTKLPLDGYEITQDTADVDAIVIIGVDLATRRTP